MTQQSCNFYSGVWLSRIRFFFLFHLQYKSTPQNQNVKEVQHRQEKRSRSRGQSQTDQAATERGEVSDTEKGRAEGQEGCQEREEWVVRELKRMTAVIQRLTPFMNVQEKANLGFLPCKTCWVCTREDQDSSMRSLRSLTAIGVLLKLPTCRRFFTFDSSFIFLRLLSHFIRFCKTVSSRE